jgi:hypothetical protein
MFLKRVRGPVPRVICIDCNGYGSHADCFAFLRKGLVVKCSRCAGTGEVSCFAATNTMPPAPWSPRYEYYHYARNKLFSQTGVLR